MTADTKRIQTTGTAAANSAALSSTGVGYAAVAAVSVVLFVICSILMMPFVPDDAFVSFRYADNLTGGHGLRFNVGGEPIEGYSNFLWVMVCAAVSRLGLSLPKAMPWVGVLFGVLNVLALAEIYRRRGVAVSNLLLPMLVFASLAPLVIHSIAAMEVPLFSLLLLLMMLAADAAGSGSRTLPYIALAITGALLALCRPEGVIAFPILLIAGSYARKKNAYGSSDGKTKTALVTAVIVFTVAVAAYHAWRMFYFGAAVPPSFYARLGGGGMIYHAWFENLRMYFVSQGSDHLPSGYFIVLLAVCGIVGASKSPSKTEHRRNERAALWLAAVFALVYFNFVDSMPGMRYHAPVLGLLFIPGVYLQPRVVAAVVTARSRIKRVKFASMVVVVLAVSFSWLAFLKMGISRAETGNQKSSVALAEWLVEAFPNGAALATNESGILPYYTGFYTIDIAEKPVIGTQPDKGWWENWFYESVEGGPDIVVITGRGVFYATMAPEHYNLVSSSRFTETYRLLGVVRYDWFEDQSYWVYIPRALPPFPKKLLDEFPVGIGSVKRLYRE